MPVDPPVDPTAPLDLPPDSSAWFRCPLDKAGTPHEMHQQRATQADTGRTVEYLCHGIPEPEETTP